MSLQVVSSPGLSPEIREYYVKNMLDKAMPELVYQRYAKKMTIPKGTGKTANWRRSALFTVNTTPLTEGVTPASDDINITNIPVTVQQYGRFVVFSDVVTVTSIDPIMTDNSDNLGQLAGNTMDAIVRDVAAAGTNVIYANSRTARNLIQSTDVMTDLFMQQIARTLQKANAKPVVDGFYVGVVSPDTHMDIQRTDSWKNTGWYQDKNAIFTGQVKALYGILWVMTTNAKVFPGAGVGGTVDVHATIVMAKDGLAVADIDGLQMEMIYKSKQSGGVEDALEQRQSQGFKFTFAAKILNEAWVLRAEHAVTQ